MKKLITRMSHVLLLIMVAIPLQATAAEFVEGTHYKAVTPPQPGADGDRIQVIEFFLYTCPHCYKLEPHMKKWEASKAENVDFIRITAMFNRSTLIMHAKTYYALELMGVPFEVHDGIFHAIHGQKKRLNTQADVEAHLDSQGVNVEQFRKAMRSFGVQANAKRAEKLLQRFNIRGVPAVIVDGKYLTSGQRPGATIEITDYLIGKVSQQKGIK